MYVGYYSLALVQEGNRPKMTTNTIAFERGTPHGCGCCFGSPHTNWTRKKIGKSFSINTCIYQIHLETSRRKLVLYPNNIVLHAICHGIRKGASLYNTSIPTYLQQSPYFIVNNSGFAFFSSPQYNLIWINSRQNGC